MSIEELNKQVSELRELRRMAEELTGEIEAIQDRIKLFMENGEKEELHGIDWRITYKAVTSNRFDSTGFKKAQPELYQQYTKPSTTRRFVLA